jgi:AcrR family transcriptional regulator
LARERDEAKRGAILAAAKRLFAARGFHAVSVADLAREVELPIGSIYTYFASKEAIVRAVVEEGWQGFVDSLAGALSGPGGPAERFSVLLYRFLPELFADVDLISIILTEAGRSFSLEDKLERLASLISGLVAELAASRGLSMTLTAAQARAAIAVFFLGGLDAVRLGRSAGVAIGTEDVIDFIRLSIENSFGVELRRP